MLTSTSSSTIVSSNRKFRVFIIFSSRLSTSCELKLRLSPYELYEALVRNVVFKVRDLVQQNQDLISDYYFLHSWVLAYVGVILEETEALKHVVFRLDHELVVAESEWLLLGPVVESC